MTDEEMRELATPPFATVSDLEARYKPLDADQTAMAEILIEDASNLLIAQLPEGWETRQKTLVLLKQVTCDLVRRRMSSVAGGNAAALPAASQFSVTTGSVSQTLSLANPYGNMKLTQDEKRLLGITRQKFDVVYPAIKRGEEDAT